MAIVLNILNGRNEHAGVAYYGAAGLQQEFVRYGICRFKQGLYVLVRRGCGLIRVLNTKAAAQIQMFNFDTFTLKLFGQHQNALYGVNDRAKFGELRADVTVNTNNFDMWKFGRLSVDLKSLFNANPKLVFIQTGGN